MLIKNTEEFRLVSRAFALKIVLTSLVLSALVTQPAAAQRFQMQSVYSADIPVLGESGVRFTEEVRRRTNGDLDIKYFDPGDIVRAATIADSVSTGVLKFAFTTSDVLVGNEPAMRLFQAVPFGASGLKQYEWVKSGAGRRLYDKYYDKLGLKAIPCSISGTEGGGWFRDPVNNVSDLNGIKMVFEGLGAKVMNNLGVFTLRFPVSEIYIGLKTGVIDASEFSMPYIDIDMAFYQVASNYYYPGWHQRAAISDLVIYPATWASLGIRKQQIIKEVCDENIQYWFEEDKRRTTSALAKLKRLGANIAPFPAEVIDAAEQQWKEVAANESANNPVFSEVYQAYQRFLQQSVPPITSSFSIDCRDLDCKFDGTSSNSQSGSISRYDWTISDGTTVNGSVVDHTFSEAGSYRVNLRVTDASSNSDSDTQRVTVSAPAANPVTRNTFRGKTTARLKKRMVPRKSGFSSNEGLIRGQLLSFNSADHMLLLQKLRNSRWRTVARSNKRGAKEAIRYRADAGRYRWVVQNRPKAGRYKLSTWGR